MTSDWRRPYPSILGILLLLGQVLLVMGCPGPKPITRGEDDGPNQHLWKPLTAIAAEPPGYGMYTYVLFGRKLKPPARLGVQTLQRYERILESIHLSTLSVAEGGALDKSDTNLFLIPLTAEVKKPTRHSYDAILSLRYITLSGAMVRGVAPALAGRLATREGPFLISTPAPLAKMTKEHVVLLYADLSTTNPAAMEEIVGAYKRRVGKRIDAVERFRSLRLALLDMILDADDNIQIVKTALAQD